jgi:uncharacterized GH25 family protein
MKRLPLIGTAVALLTAACAITWLLFAARPGPQPTMDYDMAEQDVPDRGPIGLDAAPTQGGVYAGVVVDMDDEPVPGATVLLIEYNAGDAFLESPADIEEGFVPEVGDFRRGGETTTDADGRFRIAADAQARIQHVMAYRRPDYFLDVERVMRPRDDVVLRLQRGGRVVGTVVDHETNRPVSGAIVDVYLQQKVGHMPDLPDGVDYPVVKRKQHQVEWLATLGKFLPEELGPRIWDVSSHSRESLQLRTDANGHFEIGPLGNAVQIEFVITHSKYIWFDFDTEGGKKYAKRTVVQPGETVRREFRMRTGEFIAGRLVDDTGAGLGEVVVEVQSISAYYKHPFYRHKWRRAVTDGEGRFRLEGLARGTQQIVAKHPSFGYKVESANAGTENLVIVADRLGGLRGTLEGPPPGRGGRKITIMFELLGDVGAGRGRHERMSSRVDEHGVFTLPRLAPGRYRIWIKAGGEGSQPKEVEIRPHEVTEERFEMGGGGAFSVRVVDAHGGIIDPATAVLVAVREGRDQALGTFVSREGVLEGDGVVPGSYKLRTRAVGYMEAETEPFEVSEGRSAVLPALTLRKWGYIRILHPVNETGRPAELEHDTLIEIRQGEAPWRRIFLTTGADVVVEPGPLEIRASSGEMRYEDRLQIEDGRVHEVRIVFARRR